MPCARRTCCPSRRSVSSVPQRETLRDGPNEHPHGRFHRHRCGVGRGCACQPPDRERPPSGAAARGRRRDASALARADQLRRFINRPGVNWLYASEPEPATGGRPIPVPRGKMLGGSSAINGMVWVRGQRQDYDHWAQLGNRGWSWQDVLPVFKGIESYAAATDEMRGRDGPIKVSDIDESGRLYDSFFAAAAEHRDPAQPRLQRRGSGRHRDDAGLDQRGPAHEHRARLSRAGARAAQLRVETGAKPNACSSRAAAASACATPCRARAFEARAAREVIVSAGSIASPQLLELSGIGQAERLKEARHQGAPRTARRRREPARPLGAAHEVARRPSRRDLQRARPRRPRPVAGAPLHHGAQGLPEPSGLADARLLQDAARASTAPTPCSRCSRCW